MQHIENSERGGGIDVARVGRIAAFRLLFFAPCYTLAATYWKRFPPTGSLNLIKKVLADQLVWAPPPSVVFLQCRPSRQAAFRRGAACVECSGRHCSSTGHSGAACNSSHFRLSRRHSAYCGSRFCRSAGMHIRRPEREDATEEMDGGAAVAGAGAVHVSSTSLKAPACEKAD